MLLSTLAYAFLFFFTVLSNQTDSVHGTPTRIYLRDILI